MKECIGLILLIFFPITNIIIIFVNLSKLIMVLSTHFIDLIEGRYIITKVYNSISESLDSRLYLFVPFEVDRDEQLSEITFFTHRLSIGPDTDRWRKIQFDRTWHKLLDLL